MKKSTYGYCGMTADFLHIGHIRFLEECKKRCKTLIVGIMTDECVQKYKGHWPVMNTEERIEVISSIKFVDKVFVQRDFDYPHNILRMKEFYGKDFIIFDSTEHSRNNADVLIKRTAKISSSLFRKMVNESSNSSKLTL